MVSYEDLTGEQQRAVDALDRNVTLTAGAGTGKTTTLTTRYLAMIEQSVRSQIESDGKVLLPENILTTTFTERAANELEESIRTEITDRIASIDVEEFDAWRTVADELDQGYIHTLHGFCARLLREHALTFDRLDPGFETIDEDETEALIHDVVGSVLEEYENHDVMRTLARRFSRSQLHNVLTDILAERPDSIEWAERWADATEEEYISFVEAELHPINPDEAAARLAHTDVVDCIETLQRIIRDPPEIDTGGTAWKRAAGLVELLDGDFDDGVPSRGKQSTIAKLSLHLTTGDGDRYAGYSGATTRWGDHPLKDDFDEAFETLVETLCPEEFAVNVDLDVEANSFPLVQALAQITKVAAKEYEERKRTRNVVDFTDLIAYTVEFLESEGNQQIRAELRDQFEYVMVDEFQDTDPRQWDLIKLLTASGGEFDAQNVFVVGDVKQSIYRFRNADVTQFQETAELLERVSKSSDSCEREEEGDQLSTNFRTVPTVLEMVNELFESIFVEDGEPYEAAPQRLTPAREDPANIGIVEYLAVPTDAALRASRFGHYEAFAEVDPDHDVELEAMALAAKLSQVLAEPYLVYPEDNEQAEPRDIEPSDIAILIRSRTHLKKYERALEDAGVPYSIASGIGFYESPEITALVNLFRALADPTNERALYAALRSPLFGLTDETLAHLRVHGHSLWDGLGSADSEPYTVVYESLYEWRQLAGIGPGATVGFDGSWAAYLTRIIEDTGYLVSISADERPQQAVANVEKFREQLQGWSNDGIRSLTTLVNRIERRTELGGRESEAETTDTGVQILTIHDSKGMEFPFVVVPGINREFKDDAALGGGAVEFERVGAQYAVGMKAPSPTDPFEMTDTIARETIRERRRSEERAEEKRCLYVACTRARDHLLLSGLHDLDTEADEPSFTNLAGPDPESASSWRDWIQPELLIEEVCTALDERNRVESPYGDGAFTVSVPTPEAEIKREDVNVEPKIELSPEPPASEIAFRLSATDLASLLGGYSEIQIGQTSQTAFVREIEENPDSRHGETESVGSDDEANTFAPSDTERNNTAVESMVFGEMVHRICDLRPPEDQWPALMERTLVEMDAGSTLTTKVKNRVTQHAKRGIDYVDEQTRDVNVEQQYDELYVTAEFDRGEISGYIDHLILTEETYHIIDYKTGDVTAEQMAEDAAYYLNQMKVYAVALNQQNTGRNVRVSLVFTELNDAWETEWEANEIDTIAQDLNDQLLSRID